MKALWFGIKDYLYDVSHDRLIHKISRKYKQTVCDNISNTKKSKYIESFEWKEGNIFHYIYNRRLGFSNRNKRLRLWRIEDHINTPQELMEYIKASMEENDPEYMVDVAKVIFKVRKKLFK